MQTSTGNSWVSKFRLPSFFKGFFATTSSPKNTKLKGTVNFYNKAKGFGFIKLHESEDTIFVHSSGLIDRIKKNDIVEFDKEAGKKGMNAVRVKRA